MSKHLSDVQVAKDVLSVRDKSFLRDEPEYDVLTEAAERLREKAAHRCELPSSIQEALNSGDGTYRT